jgi:crotonobetainyl-CoA:carnitine CoA-transferase CaiB-like acyl-CoA transferase
MASLLSGVRVLDLTNVLAGPFATFQLAQLGAEVIKIETPGSGDLARALGADPALNEKGMGASFLAQNAGKLSVTINLKHPKGRAAFLKLVETADVVIENFRPGVMDRLGLSSATLRSTNPRLVVCAVSGFGQTGPSAENPAYDQIVQGLSGVMAVTGTAAGGPTRAGFPVCDTVGGITAAFAVAAALFRRERTGEGETIDVSMLEATVPMLGWVVSNWLICGVHPRRLGNDNMTAAPSGTFRTGDGLLNIAANTQAQFETLCGLVGRPDLKTDPRFAAREARKTNRAALDVEIDTALAAHDAAHWERALNAAGVPAGRVLAVEDMLTHPQIVARDVVRRFADPPGVGRDVAVVRAGFRLASGDPGPEAPPPRLGEHTRAILAGAGYGEAEIDALAAQGAI